MKIKCCGYSPKDKEYLEAIIQELVYFDAWNNSLDRCEQMERQGRKWLEAWKEAR